MMTNIFAFTVLSIPILGIVGWVLTDWFRLKEKRIQAISTEAARRPPNMWPRPNGWNSGSRCSNAS